MITKKSNGGLGRVMMNKKIPYSVMYHIGYDDEESAKLAMENHIKQATDLGWEVVSASVEYHIGRELYAFKLAVEEPSKKHG